MKRLLTKFMIGCFFLSVISSCDELLSPKSAESPRMKAWVYWETIGSEYKIQKNFIEECRNSLKTYKGFEKDPNAPYSIFEFTLWRFENDINGPDRNGNIEYDVEDPTSSISYFYKYDEFDYYDKIRWDKNELDKNSTLYKQKNWADTHEADVQKNIDEIFLPKYKEFAKAFIDREVKIINWDWSENNQGDTFTGYMVTYEVGNGNYALVNLIEFDDGKWSAQMEYKGRSLQELNSLIE